MTRPYPQYCLIVAVLLSTAVFAIYWNLPALFFEAFPDTMTRLVCVAVFTFFGWMFFRHGSAAAWVLERNGAAISAFMRKECMPAQTIATELLLEAAGLRARGIKLGQADFTLLHTKTADKFEEANTQNIDRIDAVLLLLFFLGMFFTVVGIVIGFAFNKPPTNPEESKLMSFAIIKGLGLAYAISGSCLGSAVILYSLSSVLKTHAQTVSHMFADALYEVSVLGAPVEEEMSDESIGESRHAIQTK